MPHIILTHTKALANDVEALLGALTHQLASEGVSLESIKCYTLPVGNIMVAGNTGTEFLHLNLRIMPKPERTPALIREWLEALMTIVKAKLPENCTITAEANHLPDIYSSKTA
ncbi:MAG: hypothetical protein AAGB16_03810 [Pseudomonadota bacterium]